MFCHPWCVYKQCDTAWCFVFFFYVQHVANATEQAGHADDVLIWRSIASVCDESHQQTSVGYVGAFMRSSVDVYPCLRRAARTTREQWAPFNTPRPHSVIVFVLYTFTPNLPLLLLKQRQAALAVCENLLAFSGNNNSGAIIDHLRMYRMRYVFVYKCRGSVCSSAEYICGSSMRIHMQPGFKRNAFDSPEHVDVYSQVWPLTPDTACILCNTGGFQCR